MRPITALYAPVALWERHWSYVVEMAYREVELGSIPLVIHCSKALKSCAANPDNLKWKCAQCTYQVKQSILRHFPRETQHLFVGQKDINHYIETLDLPRIDNQDEMSNFYFENFPFGQSVISHLVSMNKDRHIPDNIIKSLGQPLLKNCLAMYKALENLLPGDVRKVALWGGRRSSESPMKYLAYKKGLDVLFFEEGSTVDNLFITDSDPFNFSNQHKEIRKWEAQRISRGEIQSMLHEGDLYFQQRKTGTSNEPNFIHFLRGSYPIELTSRDSKPILGIFSSSDWEFAEIETDNAQRNIMSLENQYSMLQEILNDETLNDRFEIYIRWHPNHRNAGTYEQSRIQLTRNMFPQIKHISFDENVDSYSLIQCSAVVLVFGSTIGIEAAYSGIPTVLLGNASYAGLGSVHEPKDIDELRLLLRGTIEALPTYGARVFGDYMKNRGSRLRYVNYSDSGFSIANQRVKNVKLTVRLRFSLAKIKGALTNKL